MSALAFEAMTFARKVHEHQRRKYTDAPYADHLAEVAGIVATWPQVSDQVIAVAWLHDCMEDQGVSSNVLARRFGGGVAWGVHALSDLEEGNRAQRKAAACKRLAAAPMWIQTIKCADLISNTSSIVERDPKFAKVYLAEKRALLKAMTKAYPPLWDMAWALANREPVL